MSKAAMWFQQFRNITLIEFILFLFPRSDYPNMSSFWLFHQSRHFLAPQLVSSAVHFSSVYFPSIFWLMLQYSSQILKHLCDFPLPNVDLGLQSFQCSKIHSAQHWGGRGAHLSENKGVKSESKKFGENSRQMAPVSTISDEYCRLQTL